MKQYVQADLEADRQVANTLAALIIGGALASTMIQDEKPEGQGAAAVGDPGEAASASATFTNPCTNHKRKAPSLFEKGPLALVAGAGFEPATSGL